VLLVALALVATLLVPSVYTWAVKGGAKPGIDPNSQLDKRDIDPDALAYFQRTSIDAVNERPLDVAPLGNFNPNIPPPGQQRKGLIFTQQGFFNPKNPHAFDAIPADLRPAAAHAAPAGKGLGLGSGVGIIQISADALKVKGYDAIEAELKGMGVRILDTRADRALVVKGSDKAMAELVKASFVEASLPYAGAFKIDVNAGRQMLLDKVRANKKELDVHVTAWDPAEVEGLLKDMKNGHHDNVSMVEDGATILATLSVADLRKLARDERVRNISEVPEYQLSAFVFKEHPPTVQVGENENTGSATPYWDANVDGGGCGNGAVGNTDPRNCSTPVPATIVAVLDNGASTDAATLAHSTATLTEAQISALIGGGTHRKIAAYQLVVADTVPIGSTCDSVLSGAQTHGNVIAGMIAGNASALGFQFSMSHLVSQTSVPRALNLDGAARGARLAIQDAALTSQCTAAEIVERGANVSPGSLTARMDAAYTAGARLHVMAFGIPNWVANGQATGAGTYTAESSELDKYLVNNLEYQVFVPVGNRGFSLTNGRDLICDFFDGESSGGSDAQQLLTPPLGPIFRPLQASPPSTAKNVVAAGATCEDTGTMFGPFNEEENPQNFTAKGPASAASLRAVPIVTGVGNDRAPTGGGPVPMGMYTVRSRDNNQGGPVETEIDQQARGTSFGAASIASIATILEDYFHQGFYPTGDRVQGDRVSAVSGAAVKAMLAASADFSEEQLGNAGNTAGLDPNDDQVARSRASLVTVSGSPQVLGNNQQGYGRSVASHVLPIVNWPNETVPEDFAVISAGTPEKPALGLVVWDGVDPDGGGAATAEPAISNASTQHDHHFRVLGNAGQIRACVAWPDPPGDLLVNDLDLELIDPTGKVYDGNVYNAFNQVVGQWGLGRAGGDPDQADHFNAIECVHLHDNPDANPGTADNQIVDGVWTVRVKRGAGGAVAGQISQITGANEDANNNNRLDAGEDTDGDTFLDKGGQVYGLAVAGPLVVEKDGTNTAPQFASFPQSMARLDKIRYGCSDDAAVNVWESDASALQISGATTVRVYNTSGALVDTEANLKFNGASHVFSSIPVAVRLGSGSPAVGTPGNGVIEGDTGYTVEVTYVDATGGSRTAFGRAPMDCEPNFLGGIFVIPGQRNKTDLLFGGCDTDQFFDRNELVTYSVAVVNNSRLDEYTDVTATLLACAVPFGANNSCGTPAPLSILDSPKNIGRLPQGQPEAVTFSIKVNDVAVSGQLFLRLTLANTSNGTVLGRQVFNFQHALGSDRASLHYSTDFPNGSGSIQRDINRSLVIEPNDRPGLTLGLLDETVTFSSMFTPLAGKPGNNGAITNVICIGAGNPSGCVAADEAYPALGIFNSTGDSNGIVDRHVLTDTNPAGTDLIPWNFDANNGGWYTQRDAASNIGASAATLPVWHYVQNGTCGFQTQSKSNCVQANGTPGFDNGLGGGCVAIPAGAFVGGVWHTGSGVTGTCAVGGAACYLNSDCGANGPCNGGADNPECGNYGLAFNDLTGRRAEFLLDYFISPVIEKVNQGTDANGNPFTVEFQRLGFNESIQFYYNEPTLYIDVDNDIDHDVPKAIVRPGNGPRGDGTQYYIATQTGPIDPHYTVFYYNQVTFGPRTDPDGSLSAGTPTLTGDETGFTGFDNASGNDYYAIKPIIPTAPTNLRPFPGPCQGGAGSCPAGAAEPHVGEDTVAGPSRGLEFDSVDYEDNGLQFFTPGDAGNRFQIGLAFLYVEQNPIIPSASDGDFGVSVDDVVFEWDEVHPAAEATPSCSRIGIGAGEIAAGCKCATLSVDRTNLYDCNETLRVTVNDSRYGAGAASPCIAGTAGGSNDTIQVKVWSNSDPFPGETISLAESATAGVFTGQIQVSGVFNSPGVVFTVPGTETNVFVAYEDSQCDSNQNHIAGQSSFANLDGDGVPSCAGRDGIPGSSDDITTCNGLDGICGFNPATGSIDDVCTAPAGPSDNCPTVYNPLQVDDDGDKVGGTVVGGTYFGCDNCPFIYNPSQADGDLDGVGDVCDNDDVDNDGLINATDLCPDVPDEGHCTNDATIPCSTHGGPLAACVGGTCVAGQVLGGGGHGEACDDDPPSGCTPNVVGPDNYDGDAVCDETDNCDLTPNSGQADADGDGLGDACDGDCLGTCSNDATKRCFVNSNCVSPGTCTVSRVCSGTNDDADGDLVQDNQDNCAVTYNQTILPGSDPPVQSDDNFNLIGNACDPVGHFDENRDGIPDDVANGPFFAMAATCKNVPLAELVVLSPLVRDRAELGACPSANPAVRACLSGPNVGKACTTLGATCAGGATCADVANACGDGDAFGDPGERVRLGLVLQNITGINLTGINLSLSTGDPDIACILDAAITIASFPNGTTLDTRTLTPVDDAAQPTDGKFFEVVIASTTTTNTGTLPARGNLTLTMNSNEVGGTTVPIPVAFLEDIDVPTGATVTPTASRCDADLAPSFAGAACASDANCGNVPTSCKPGLIYEDFEIQGPSPTGTGGISQNNDFSSTFGFIERNAAADSNTSMVGQACFGFMEIGGRTGPQGCQIDPDFDTDWHFDSTTGPIPAEKAFHGTKSAHWGRHTDAAERKFDTTPLREIEAFDTNPINLTILPNATIGDLFMSFWHIADFADDNAINFQVDQSGDHADVQISVDQDPGAGDNFGRWQKLIPFQNVYDHTTQVWSWFGYCEFTPTDAANANVPGSFGETMCFPDGVWSHSGNVLGTNVFSFFNAQGPGSLGSIGEGIWVQSKFNLGLFLGQRVKFRWVGQGWDFGNGWDSYLEPPGAANPFDIGTRDDGWWIDSIQITGAVTTPIAPAVETTSIPLTSQCPATAAAKCNEALGTNGFTVDFRINDADGDGVIVVGESLLLDASQTANPGGCADGVAQFRFSKVDGGGTTVLQDWSTSGNLKLGNTATTSTSTNNAGDLYQVEVRCSSDFSCTTAPVGPPVGAVAGGCNVYAGPPPAATEPSLSGGLFGAVTCAGGTNPGTACTAAAQCLGGGTCSVPAPAAVTISNYLLNGPGTPPHLSMPRPVYGHAFVRTAALGVGNGLVAGGTDGGLTGTCTVSGCTPAAGFSNVASFTTNGLAGVSSCDIDAVQHACNPPTPSQISLDDSASNPLSANLYYYLGNIFTTPAGVTKVFATYGQARTESCSLSPTDHCGGSGGAGVKSSCLSCSITTATRCDVTADCPGGETCNNTSRGVCSSANGTRSTTPSCP
jgi:hypothetical protein